ncbi:MAG TPA: DinB family protein [Thermomicrobiales bacterium]|nr:DinB family protein [Thermomicrobiales bacterium]
MESRTVVNRQELEDEVRSSDVRMLFEYSYAATERILTAARGLSSVDFAAVPPLRGASGIQQTLVHMLDTERGWRENLRAGRRNASPELNPADFSTVPALAQEWGADREIMLAWVASLDDDTLNDEAFNGRILWQCLVHVVNHSTQHRSEVAMILTHFGCSPGDLDLTYFLRGWTDA